MSQPPGYYYGGKTFPDSHTYEPEESEVWRAHEVRLHLTLCLGFSWPPYYVGYFRLDRMRRILSHATQQAPPLDPVQ